MNVSPDVSTEDFTVLVADDETALTDSLAVWLSDEYSVRTAYSGREAIEKYDSTVDVVLLDYRMPDLTGDQVFERLHERPGNARVAILTATDPQFRRENVESPSFDESLTKPIAKGELLAAVERLVAETFSSPQ